MQPDVAWGFSLGYRETLRVNNLIGDLEDEVMSCHFESWAVRLQDSNKVTALHPPSANL
jgi:hypothetical protein